MTHPGKKVFVVAAILLFFAVVMSFIAVFVPWAWKDIAPGQRLWAYPFKQCVEYTFSTRNAEFCQDNDFSADNDVSGGNKVCRGFIVTAIAFVVIDIIVGVVTLLVFALLFWCSLSRITACIIQLGLFVVFVASMLAWIMWINYANYTCRPDSVLFPLGGYSYGFICQVFSTFLFLLALIAGYIGMYLLFTIDLSQGPLEEPVIYFTPPPCPPCLSPAASSTPYMPCPSSVRMDPAW